MLRPPLARPACRGCSALPPGPRRAVCPGALLAWLLPSWWPSRSSARGRASPPPTSARTSPAPHTRRLSRAPSTPSLASPPRAGSATLPRPLTSPPRPKPSRGEESAAKPRGREPRRRPEWGGRRTPCKQRSSAGRVRRLSESRTVPLSAPDSAGRRHKPGLLRMAMAAAAVTAVGAASWGQSEPLGSESHPHPHRGTRPRDSHRRNARWRDSPQRRTRPWYGHHEGSAAPGVAPPVGSGRERASGTHRRSDSSNAGRVVDTCRDSAWDRPVRAACSTGSGGHVRR